MSPFSEKPPAAAWLLHDAEVATWLPLFAKAVRLRIGLPKLELCLSSALGMVKLS